MLNLSRTCSLFNKLKIFNNFKYGFIESSFHTTNSLDSMYEKRARDKAKRLASKKKFEMKSVMIKNEMTVKELPNAGDEVLEMKSEHLTKDLLDLRSKKENLIKIKDDKEIINKKRKEHDELYRIKKEERRSKGQRFIQDSMYDKKGEIVSINSDENLKDFQPKTMHIILKTDVNGSLDAILSVLDTYDLNEKVVLDLVHFEVGQIKKTDLEKAEAFNATIYCFNLPVDQLELTNTNKNIQIKHFNVIYQMFDDLKEELRNLAPLEEEEQQIGEALVQKCFNYNESNSKTILVAGSRCQEGIIEKKQYFRIVRNNEIVSERLRCSSLKHIKTDINTVKRNVEFGISFDDSNLEVMPDDKILCYSIKMVKSPIEWNLGF